MLRLVVSSIFVRKKQPFVPNLRSLGAGMFGHSLPTKSKERPSCEIFDTLSMQHVPALTYASVVYEVTDADDGQAQNCSTSVCVFTAIRRQFLYKWDQK